MSAVTRLKDDLYVAAQLREVGLDVGSIFDLVNSNESFPEAFPVLMNVFSKTTDTWIKQGIVRALADKRAGQDVTRFLMAEFSRISPEADEQMQSLKWAIGNSLAEVADDSSFNELVKLATDKRHGSAREMLVWGLSKMKNPMTEQILISLLDDDEVTSHSVAALGRRKAKSAEARLAKLADSDHRNWVRQEAKKALKRIRSAKD